MRSLLLLALLLFAVLGIQPRFTAQAQTESMHQNREVLIASSADAPGPARLEASPVAPSAQIATIGDHVAPRKAPRPNLMSLLTTFAEGLSGGLALTIFLALTAITMPRVSWGLREARVA